MKLTSKDVLFCGKGNTAISWYRTGLPAMYLGCDWVAVYGQPPKLGVLAAISRQGVRVPDFYSYKIVILQQVKGREWLSLILKLQKAGITVLYEIDDYIHGVRKVVGHQSAHNYTKAKIKEHEICMKAADGLIVSTDFLAEQYRKFNKQIWVCPAGLQTTRYSQFALPERDTINIGWAGGFGHEFAVRAWLPSVERIMDEHESAQFISVGLPVADLIERHKDRATALPNVQIENFPGVLCNFDIALGPAEDSSFYRGKSDLRFVETGALGIPLIGSPIVYGEAIEDGRTGLLAHSPEEAYSALKRLVENATLRSTIGANAKAYVQKNRSIEVTIEAWEKIFMTC